VGNGNPKKGGGGGGGRDMVMESRHLLGVFLGIVVLCGVFFTLGYVMGRTQYDTNVRAAINSSPAKPAVDPASKPPQKTATSVPAAGDWNFYRAAESKPPAQTLKPSEPPKQAASPGQAASAPPVSAKPAPRNIPAQMKAPLIPRGAILLQIAALTRENDALALAEALQQKEYPAFVLAPAGDNLYRVQVGPYADAKSADSARRSLERDGFKAITKR
jgi:cell division septation protein DedD